MRLSILLYSLKDIIVDIEYMIFDFLFLPILIPIILDVAQHDTIVYTDNQKINRSVRETMIIF